MKGIMPGVRLERHPALYGERAAAGSWIAIQCQSALELLSFARGLGAASFGPAACEAICQSAHNCLKYGAARRGGAIHSSPPASQLRCPPRCSGASVKTAGDKNGSQTWLYL